MRDESRGPRRRHNHLAAVGVLLITLSFLVSAAAATGSGPEKKATLKISGVPASVKEGGTFKVTASGYAGNFTGLNFFPLIVGAVQELEPG